MVSKPRNVSLGNGISLSYVDHGDPDGPVLLLLPGPTDPALARSFLVDTSSTALRGSFVDELVGEVVKVPARVWREMFADMLRYDDASELSSVTAPASLVWGDADTLVSHDAQDRLVRTLPHAELTVYADTGHTPRWQLPSRFAADVASFVARCTAAAT